MLHGKGGDLNCTPKVELKFNLWGVFHEKVQRKFQTACSAQVLPAKPTTWGNTSCSGARRMVLSWHVFQFELQVIDQIFFHRIKLAIFQI
ncbi:hypothetical protein EV681_1995 [Advenella incenata]|uniref:Uncharacterized protein n=1 Tax=Advenella incenata TaxID=267800 RepID=A0A4Q7VU81_9BURK|nr:hypothetical protein EV681_1995 [Advenella incenata]